MEEGGLRLSTAAGSTEEGCRQHSVRRGHPSTPGVTLDHGGLDVALSAVHDDDLDVTAPDSNDLYSLAMVGNLDVWLRQQGRAQDRIRVSDRPCRSCKILVFLFPWGTSIYSVYEA
jgi:hypothetical protein